jgi:hypothetical protein
MVKQLTCAAMGFWKGCGFIFSEAGTDSDKHLSVEELRHYLDPATFGNAILLRKHRRDQQTAADGKDSSHMRIANRFE